MSSPALDNRSQWDSTPHLLDEDQNHIQISNDLAESVRRIAVSLPSLEEAIRQNSRRSQAIEERLLASSREIEDTLRSIAKSKHSTELVPTSGLREKFSKILRKIRRPRPPQPNLLGSFLKDTLIIGALVTVVLGLSAYVSWLQQSIGYNSIAETGVTTPYLPFDPIRIIVTIFSIVSVLLAAIDAMFKTALWLKARYQDIKRIEHKDQ